MQILLLSWILAAKNGTTFAEWCEFYKKWLVKSWNQNYHDLKIQLQGWKHTSKFKPHVQPLRSGHGTLNCKWKQALLKVTSITGSYNALMIVFWCGHFFVSKKMDEFVTAICTCWKMKTSIRICLYQMALGWCFWKYLTLWWKWSFLMYNGCAHWSFHHVQRLAKIFAWANGKRRIDNSNFWRKKQNQLRSNSNVQNVLFLQ